MFFVISLKKIIKFILILSCLILAAALGIYGLGRVYPVRYINIIEDKAGKYNLDKAFVCGVIHTESRFKPDARSPKGAGGLMQLTKSTADWGAKEIGIQNYSYDRILEPELNIEIGCWYLKKLLDQYGNNKTVALAAYNGGSGNVSKWLGNAEYSEDGVNLKHIPFKETENYIERVNKSSKIYSYIINIYKSITTYFSNTH